MRGRGSPTYLGFARKLRGLAPEAVREDLRTLDERISDALWVIESEATGTQGTGFFLRDVGFVTCAHVVHPDSVAFRASEPLARFPLTIRQSNSAIDLAICDFAVQNPPCLHSAIARPPKVGDKVILCGFPNFRRGDTPLISPGVVVAFRVVSIIRRLVMSAQIVSGNSGGPVLNSDGAVIGVAVTGTDRPELPSDTVDYGVVPISAVDHLLDEAGLEQGDEL